MYCAYISVFRVVPTTAGNVFFYIFSSQLSLCWAVTREHCLELKVKLLVNIEIQTL